MLRQHRVVCNAVSSHTTMEPSVPQGCSLTKSHSFNEQQPIEGLDLTGVFDMENGEIAPRKDECNLDRMTYRRLGGFQESVFINALMSGLVVVEGR